MTTDEEKKAIDQQIEHAYALLAESNREEALEIAMTILRKEPGNMGAQAIRDRVYTEENTERLAVETEADREEGDESPIVPYLMLCLGVGCAIGATFLCIKFALLGFKVGFTAEVTAKPLFSSGNGKYPVHNLFFYPLAMYLISAISLYGYRRYMRNR